MEQRLSGTDFEASNCLLERAFKVKKLFAGLRNAAANFSRRRLDGQSPALLEAVFKLPEQFLESVKRFAGLKIAVKTKD